MNEVTPQKTGIWAWLGREVRETLVTIAIFAPIWLVFTSLVFEMRSIPSESMVPSLQVGDRVVVNKFVYGYSRYSPSFGTGRLLPLGEGRWLGEPPEQGDVVVFVHPRLDKVMIKRLIGMPGDVVEMKSGRLIINGEPVSRQFVRRTNYRQHRGSIVTAAEYFETLPNGKRHLIHEFADDECLDRTPVFQVPPGHYFMMGDNRDNSLDSRAIEGHPELAAQVPGAWNCPGQMYAGEPGIGFVPSDNLLGRAETVLFTFNFCRNTRGLDCPAPRVWRGLSE
jgi:signal peptidase I